MRAVTVSLGLCARAVSVAIVASSATGTETEHLNASVLPAPGPVVVDGGVGDWDLTGGIFACGDVEDARDEFAVWFHAMYDEEKLYLLARWVDPTPMNNPGSSKGDYGFRGDCLQVRVVTAPDVRAREVVRPGRDSNDAPTARTAHLTCWRDRDGVDVVDVAYGRRFKEGSLKDAQTKGARQEFLKDADGRGYTQEISLPWKLLAKPGVEVKAGSSIMITIEPNFTIGTGGRLSIKDIFKPGVAIDRVFTFQGNKCWGYATLEARGNVPFRPVRLSDGREYPVSARNGLPVIDWTGLVKSDLPDGFKAIRFELPEGGYVSLNVFAPDRTVARQLLTCHRLAKGAHEIRWDGLATMSVRRPGRALPAGVYTWEGFYHTGIGLALRGWAGNSGSAPWRGFGADHGNPKACAAAGEFVYFGWHGGEGDKPLVACDLDGNIRWKNIRGGIAGADLIATDGETVFAFNPIGQYVAKAIYRVDARTGRYTEWSDLKSTDLTMRQIWGGEGAPDHPSGISARDGRLFVSFSDRNAVAVVDIESGRTVKRLDVRKPSDIEALSADEILVVSAGGEVLSVEVRSGRCRRVLKPRLDEGNWISALAADAEGDIYVGIRGNSHHVEAYSSGGRFRRRIGREGGRKLVGPWTPDGMLNVSALAVDAHGRLWVAEDDGTPRRVSAWDTRTGEFAQEMFGASSYGATGAAVNPKDPDLLVGQGCEWRIDPRTGRAAILGTITRKGMSASRFGRGSNGRLYLAVTAGFLHGQHAVRIYERLGDADYKLRTVIHPPDKEKGIRVWSDENGDASEQPGEIETYRVDLGGWLQGWYMSMSPDLSFYGSLHKVMVTGFTACGAPKYDLPKAKRLAGPPNARHRGGMGAQRGHGSADGRFMLYNAGYGVDHGTVDCYDVVTGQFRWTYPSNFTGVHGSHRACGPTLGMMRGAYDITGVAKLPPPVGNVWVIPTNKGEWHVLTEKGFYLTRLFEGDPTKNVYPKRAAPGVSLDTCPPGAGEEAFGGSVTQARDGRLFVQAGHISYWVAEVTGLDTVRPLAGGRVTLTAGDVIRANELRGKYLAGESRERRMEVKKATPEFTGDLGRDFKGQKVVRYKQTDAAEVRTAFAYDDEHLYAAWQVKDDTPWVNGADAPEFMYARGDTVDIQLGTDPKADPKRRKAVMGDLRISIGPFGGRPTAVVYRKVAREKAPKSFSSGVVKGYVMESVRVLDGARVEVRIDRARNRYTVEAAIPLGAVGLRPAAGLEISGDFGVTHGNRAGNDTVLRTCWSNRNTGLVSDEVFELQMAPAMWGTIVFKR
ncbi:MAG: hypothetical protein ACYSU0_00425 [Planctomycetota bacterium]|jgi:hypothetical protein